MEINAENGVRHFPSTLFLNHYKLDKRIEVRLLQLHPALGIRLFSGIELTEFVFHALDVVQQFRTHPVRRIVELGFLRRVIGNKIIVPTGAIAIPHPTLTVVRVVLDVIEPAHSKTSGNRIDLQRTVRLGTDMLFRARLPISDDYGEKLPRVA